MAGPLKRTGLRSSSEDAEHFRKFHAHVLSTLRGGGRREDLLKELVAGGVPEKTAERIVVASEQEIAAESFSPGLSRRQRWGVVAFAVAVFVGIGGYIVREMARDHTLSFKYALPALVFCAVMAAVIIRRFFFSGKGPLEPPRFR